MKIFQHLKRMVLPSWQRDLHPVEENFIRIRSVNEAERPSIGILNQSYLNYGHKQHFPWLIRVKLYFDPDALNEFGLPLDHELCKAYDFEGSYKSLFESNTPSHFIGHLIFQGTFTIWWHVRDKKEALRLLQSDHKSQLNLNISTDFDPDWTYVCEYAKTEFHTALING